MRVLVVEDEKKTASFIRKALQAEGFAVDVCGNGDDALAAVAATDFDGLVLDIMLPGRDGLSVLRQLRERGNKAPVLLLSARGEVNERVEGLNAGADDYLVKPFDTPELLARLRALIRPDWFAAKGRLLPRAARPPPKLEGSFDRGGELPPSTQVPQQQAATA